MYSVCVTRNGQVADFGMPKQMIAMMIASGEKCASDSPRTSSTEETASTTMMTSAFGTGAISPALGQVCNIMPWCVAVAVAYTYMAPELCCALDCSPTTTPAECGCHIDQYSFGWLPHATLTGMRLSDCVCCEGS